mmetsp:Transcript_19415/g.74541  ORF Transcript_19415/g.74541 Transcript_19415/m.74541 type:complete len:338 (-) Transcript_19415:77-1090(-)|eukprot:CAMPEP_0114609042 /NCGR_PEP_ID=MMETSP0168-20121206/2887_1 /TAXON_ID=95228 ORGANISM="Vannella sp., Strain DIVA3 517/6/12" /NCGR_SAMPLE_ID=MMETSP0168 /ASSEMBLY_ACC=CAM_ASM_000044 /LENGTH=337 /DNA_ID=CAMNT_0001819953 /DNA_START=34 /DNA_END=1047 /DNA_ORIENTATION=-
MAVRRSGRKDKEGYFDCYTHIGIHEDMLADKSRTGTYRQALMQSQSFLKEAVVMDVGMGTGVLSLFASQAGARLVIGVEASDVAAAATVVVLTNGMKGKVEVVHSTVEELEELPGEVAKVDAIVSEWMGYALFYEFMLDSVIHARDKFLRPGGRMYPESARLFLAPFDDEAERSAKRQFWKSQYGLDFSGVAAYEERLRCSEADVRELDPSSLLALRAACVKEIDCHTVTAEGLECSSPFEFQVIGSGRVHGFALWFDVGFATDGERLTLGTGPEDEPTHWAQTLIYLAEAQAVEQDDVISGEFQLRRLGNSRGVAFELSFAVNGGPKQEQSSAMPW